MSKPFDDKLYLDLGDEAWRAVEITTTGWRVVENPNRKGTFWP